MVTLLAALLAGCGGGPCPTGTVRGGDDCVDVVVGDPVPHDDVPRPEPGAAWQIQLDGALDTSVDATTWDVDLFDVPQATMTDLAARGTLICYLSAGSWEAWRDDADAFPAKARGRPLQGWAGELWLDVMDADVRRALEDRLDLAVAKGCEAVDPDNVDGWATQTGFPLTPDEGADFVRFLADAAHRRGLGVGLKNDPAQAAELLPWVDFAVVEECLDYDECGAWAPFVDAGLAVLGIAYPATREDLAAAADRVCPSAPAGHDLLIKELTLGPERIACDSRPGFSRTRP